MSLRARLSKLLAEGQLNIPLPGKGQTSLRHRRLAEIARVDVSVARLAEAHVDAVAILAEAGKAAEPDVLYGVWASEVPGQSLRLEVTDSSSVTRLYGTKMFCTGAGLVDRALITVREPEPSLINVDLRRYSEQVHFDPSGWHSPAFAETQTATAQFEGVPIESSECIGSSGWYTGRPGFWHGACGPAACWAGGAVGLVDYSLSHARDDSHALAHCGALYASAWSMWSILEAAGKEIDADPGNSDAAVTRALTVRHLIETACSDILGRFGRTFGPRPLAFDEQISRRYQEVQLYIRQSHAEHDLEMLGRRVCGK